MTTDRGAWSDQELVSACVEHYPFAVTEFEELLRRYEPLIYRFCVAYLGDAHDAEDATQEAFARAYFALPRLRVRSAFRSWLYRISTRACAQNYRSRRRWRDLPAALERDAAVQPSVTPAHARAVSDREAAVSQALQGLDEDERALLLLRHLAELEFKQLANHLGIGLSAAKMRVYRAEQRLRTLLEAVDEPALVVLLLVLHLLNVTFDLS